MCSVPLLPLGPQLVQTCTGSVHASTALWVHAHPAVFRKPGSLVFFIFSGSFHLSSSSFSWFPEPHPRGKDMLETFSYNRGFQELSFRAHCPGCVCSHPLQKEASLVMLEQDRYLRVAECHRESFYCCISLANLVVFGFSLGPWPIESQAN